MVLILEGVGRVLPHVFSEKMVAVVEDEEIFWAQSREGVFAARCAALLPEAPGSELPCKF